MTAQKQKIIESQKPIIHFLNDVVASVETFTVVNNSSVASHTYTRRDDGTYEVMHFDEHQGVGGKWVPIEKKNLPDDVEKILRTKSKDALKFYMACGIINQYDM